MYITTEEAKQLLAQRLNCDDFLRYANVQQNQALYMAGEFLDRFNYYGSISSNTQEHQFPRNGDTEIPKNIKIAAALLALEFLRGFTSSDADNNVRIISQSYDSIKTIYQSEALPDYQGAGFPNAYIWTLVSPFIKRSTGITLNRV